MWGRLTLQRRDEQTAIQEDLTYSYYDVTNKLKNVDGSTTENYTYDEIGNLISDNAEGIDSITWTPYGKVRAVYKDDNSEVHFRYDASGNRIAKITETDTTIYARDASGNVMAVYRNDTLTEQSIYGSSRLGLVNYASKTGYRSLGGKKYELTNHLGNVLAVVSDNIHLDQDSTWTSLINTTDYYPFGLAMDGRSVQDSTYRYGFNGKEADDEINGPKKSYKTEFRQYDPVLGKWWGVDPLAIERSWVSPYNFVQNNPVNRIDPDGLLDNPIVNSEGEFQGFDEFGAGGDAIVYDGPFKEGMSQDEIFNNGGKSLNDFFVGNKFSQGQVMDFQSKANQSFKDKRNHEGLMATGELIADISTGLSFMTGGGSSGRAVTSSRIAARGIGTPTIQFGQTSNQISHTFRHTDKLGLSREAVKSTVETHLQGVSHRMLSSQPFNQIVEVAGQRIQYTAFKLENGIVNVGRIHGL